MKKSFITYITTAALVCFLGLTACSDFLDVQPRDRFLEPQVFSSEGGIHTFFNGLYLDLANPDLYGENLTMSTVEVIGQQYNSQSASGGNQGGRTDWRPFGTYDYADQDVRDKFDQIWRRAYESIMNINLFIEKLDASSGVIPASRAALLKGEALGLRALVHFDMLRLFGPVYSVNPDRQGVPYYTKADANVVDIMSASDVIQRVLDDLEDAEELLAEDPIITEGVLKEELTGEEDDFYKWRSERINYYAVKALQARVHLYAGNEAEALTAALYVIDEAGVWFPWSDPNAVTTSSNPDRVFSSEVIFGLYNPDMYARWDFIFDYTLTSNNRLAAHSTRVTNIYESNENDYRYNTWHAVPPIISVTGRTFVKFADVSDSGMAFRFLQPLVRLSEMYYIAAETHPDPDEGLALLNTVRFNRGLPDLSAGVDLQEEIRKEYHKEFYGEGQMFFYYKRRAMTTIPNGSNASGTLTVGDDQYVVPLPLSETEYRN